MRILFITPSIPSRFNRIRAFQLIKYLSKNHRIHLVSLSLSSDTADTAELSRYCASVTLVPLSRIQAWFNCVRFLFSSRPLEVSYVHSRRMQDAVMRAAIEHSVDLVYVKRLRSAQFAENLAVGKPVMLDVTDAMSRFYDDVGRSAPWYLKPFYRSEAWRYRAYERRMFAHFKTVVACSPEDVTYLEKFAPEDVRIALVPNAADTEFYTPSVSEVSEPRILFSGLMNKRVNAEAVRYFARDVFPLVLKEEPRAHLSIVGPSPLREVRNLAGDNISVEGRVPDIRTAISSTLLVVCPVLHGAGTRNKILQAWAAGRPVVSTEKGCEGLSALHDKQLLIADTPEDFAAQTVRLLREPELRRRLIEGGRERIAREYSLARVGQTLDELIARQYHVGIDIH